MKHFLITTTPEDPKLGDFGLVQADNQLAALDAYAVEQGFASYSSASPEEFHEAVGIDNHGLWALCGNQTIWAVEIKPSVSYPISQLRCEGVTVSVTRNTTTGHLIVLINTGEVAEQDQDPDGDTYIEIILDDATIHDNESVANAM